MVYRSGFQRQDIPDLSMYEELSPSLETSSVSPNEAPPSSFSTRTSSGHKLGIQNIQRSFKQSSSTPTSRPSLSRENRPEDLSTSPYLSRIPPPAHRSCDYEAATIGSLQFRGSFKWAPMLDFATSSAHVAMRWGLTQADGQPSRPGEQLLGRDWSAGLQQAVLRESQKDFFEEGAAWRESKMHSDAITRSLRTPVVRPRIDADSQRFIYWESEDAPILASPAKPNSKVKFQTNPKTTVLDVESKKEQKISLNAKSESSTLVAIADDAVFIPCLSRGSSKPLSKTKPEKCHVNTCEDYRNMVFHDESVFIPCLSR